MIPYRGEHIWAGQWGHMLVILSFVSAFCLALLCVAKTKFNLKHWITTGVIIHAISVAAVAGLLIFMLLQHFYEYQYVWQHSNSEMDMRYIFSCLWEGQEGSFLLWLFWNSLLCIGVWYQLRNSTLLKPVLSILFLIQAFIASMLLGVYVLDYKIGSSPFLLLREHSDFMHLPFVKSPEYLNRLDGRGLNPLLMNAWMTIHPPTLFLGFALTGIPFAFALSGLWQSSKPSMWAPAAYPWAIAAMAVLGIGILMGGAWAYEALSFGGFWAWDPVENSSLVPWLLMVAGTHAILLNLRKKGSNASTYISTILPFLTVLYSTFLTRSGILGNASVHAFTDLGMTGQLLIYLITFVYLAVTPVISNSIARAAYLVLSPLVLIMAAVYQHIPWGFYIWISYTLIHLFILVYSWFIASENHLFHSQRSSFMRMGILWILLTSAMILFFTSVPVINTLFSKHYAPPSIDTYNQWMTPMVILILFLMTWAHQLTYSKNYALQVLYKIRWWSLLALAIAICICVPFYILNPPKGYYSIWYWQLGLCVLVLICIWGLFLHLRNILRIKASVWIETGGALAHIGFILVILGAVMSTSKKTNLTSRPQAEIPGIKTNAGSIMLTRGDTVQLGPYWVTYAQKKRVGMDVFFTIQYFHKTASQQFIPAFTLQPKVQDNPRMGKAADPDTKHFLSHDVYTHVAYADLTDQTQAQGYSQPVNMLGHIGDTISLRQYLLILDSIRTQMGNADSSMRVTLVLRGIDVKGSEFMAYPTLEIKNRMLIPKPYEIKDKGLKLVFWNIKPEAQSFEITVQENAALQNDFIVMEAYAFPFINILWIGVMVMALGTFMTLFKYIFKSSS